MWHRLRRQLRGLRFRRQVAFDKIYCRLFACFEPKSLLRLMDHSNTSCL
ncbi:MAG: hypothetical protein KIT56_04920 [Gammaproteobacteria bacterium]|nr:hypothetical protein [Gammaproteobacteria bacterium]